MGLAFLYIQGTKDFSFTLLAKTRLNKSFSTFSQVWDFVTGLNQSCFIFSQVWDFVTGLYQSCFVFSQVRESDLVMPEQARAVAKELGLPYYETSVLTYFGVNQVNF